MMPDTREIAHLIDSATVSIDISTDDDTIGDRIFGRVYSVQLEADGSLTILAEFTEDNRVEYLNETASSLEVQPDIPTGVGDLREALIVALWDRRTGDQHASEARIVDRLLPKIADYVQSKQADVWDEAYGMGVHDEATSQDLTGGIFPPARVNPYRKGL